MRWTGSVKKQSKQSLRSGISKRHDQGIRHPRIEAKKPPAVARARPAAGGAPGRRRGAASQREAAPQRRSEHGQRQNGAAKRTEPPDRGAAEAAAAARGKAAARRGPPGGARARRGGGFESCQARRSSRACFIAGPFHLVRVAENVATFRPAPTQAGHASGDDRLTYGRQRPSQSRRVIFESAGQTDCLRFRGIASCRWRRICRAVHALAQCRENLPGPRRRVGGPGEGRRRRDRLRELPSSHAANAQSAPDVSGHRGRRLPSDTQVPSGHLCAPARQGCQYP